MLSIEITGQINHDRWTNRSALINHISYLGIDRYEIVDEEYNCWNIVATKDNTFPILIFFVIFPVLSLEGASSLLRLSSSTSLRKNVANGQCQRWSCIPS